ncbi:hypothetical protein L2Y94_14395 [Luteibacter aegosomatis]|uniref:hypothetical protein n=1 Tax=Luteibacter aegosomatis TaxID=2911537 RepID=UPI001FF85BA8|nr:hypothetical protein [Luteibacter aegosomatis]UPG84521.1 hypothetical protein L2Y94_14395 [Luteibacter aegosomatis]
MFPPSIEQLLGAASNGAHYRTMFTRDAIAVEASGPEDHARAMEFVREAMREGWGDRIHARPTPVVMTGAQPVPASYPAQVVPAPAAPVKSVSPPPSMPAIVPAAASSVQPSGIPMESTSMESARIESTSPTEAAPVAHETEGMDTEDGEKGAVTGGEKKRPPRPREHPVGQADSAQRHRIHHRALMQRASMKAARKPSSTLIEQELVTDIVIDILGNKPVAEVTEDDIRRVVDLFQKMPKNVGRRKDFAMLSRLGVIKAARKQKLKTIDTDTFIKHLKTLITFFNACKAVNGTGMTGSPCDWIVLKHYRKKRRQKRDTLDQPERQLILDECMKSKEPVKYWGFRIADLTGMRSNEICQLELCDIGRMEWKGYGGIREHIDYFDINEEGEDQHVKSSCSVRRLPIPQALLDDGFLRYVEDVRKAGGKHLFPGLSWNDKRPGRALSNFVNPTLRKLGIRSPRKVLHSTRNTWTTDADLSSVPRSVIRAVNGHADGSDIDDNTYTARATLVAIKKGMDAVDTPYLQFRPYQSEKFAKAISAGVAREQHDERLKKEGKSLNRRAGRPAKESSDGGTK